MKSSDFWVNYPFKFRPTGCGGTSIGEEISGRYNLRLLFRDVRPNAEEEAAASEWPLTRLIIFLAAAQTKRNNLRMNRLPTEFKMCIIRSNPLGFVMNAKHLKHLLTSA